MTYAIDFLQENASDIQAIGTILAVFVAAWTIWHASRINKVNKIIEVWQYCALRGEALKEMLLICETANRDERRWTSYWSRFWSLKSDQFDFWLNGYLDHDTFCDWSFETIKSVPDPVREAGNWMDFHNGWMAYVSHGTAIANPLFEGFVNELIKIAHTDFSLGLEGSPDSVDRVVNTRKYDAMTDYVGRELVGTWFHQKLAWLIPRKFAGEISWAEHTRLMHKAREKSLQRMRVA